MAERSYFLAHGESETKVREFFEARRSAHQAAEALAKEVGGKGAAVGWSMAGVIFEANAPEGWTCKGTTTDGIKYHMPLRRTKAGKELCKRISAIRVPDAKALHSQFSADGGHFASSGMGFAIHYISAEIAKGKAIISVPAGMDFTPPDTTPLKMSEYWAIKEGETA